VRRYEAVDNPLLRNLKNVIVFPMDGPKSMAAELSGGDLDGDTFWISWDQRLLFSENYEALCYTNPTDKPDDKTASGSNQSYCIADICRFFVEYIEADNLGVIAIWHMALADLHGVEDKRCLDLACMHRFAIDRIF
jgi:RNA-dependent RNA polymerase